MSHLSDSSKPFVISFHQDNFIKVVKVFAKTLGVKVRNDEIKFPKEIAEGYYKAYEFENGMSATVNMYTVNHELQINRLPNKDFGVIIYLFEFMSESDISYVVNDSTTVRSNHKVNHALRIVSTQTRLLISLPPGCHVKAVSIYLEEKWIKKNLGAGILRVMNFLKETNYFKEYIHFKQRKLLNEIFSLHDDHSYPEVFVKSRILTLLDGLFRNLQTREISSCPEKISEKDFEMIQRVEYMLIEHVEKGFPSIEKLARLALMSESKLKTLFKQSFGMGLYEYYQKNRMLKAKELLKTRKYTVSQIGHMLGYQNLGNFSSAFRKEFNCLPSELKVA